LEQKSQQIESNLAEARSKRVWIPFLYLSPFLATFCYILAFGVNIPANDDWMFVETFRAAHQGTHAFLEKVWIPHLEHRMLVPKLVLTGLAYASAFNVKLNMIVSALLVLIAYIGIVRILRRDERGDELILHTSAITAGVLMFSLVHQETWLLGYGLAFVLAAFFSLMAILALAQDRWRPHVRIGFSSLFCLLASFSAGSGLLSWIAILPSVVFMFKKKTRIWAGSAVICLFVITCIIYFVDYHPSVRSHDWGWCARHPAQVILFAFMLVGAPFCQLAWGAEAHAAPWIGGALCAGFLFLTVVAVRQRRAARVAPWLSIGLFGLGAAALISVGRAGPGAGSAATSRYMIFSICLPVGMILTLGALARSAVQRWIFVIVAGELVLLQLSGYSTAIAEGREVRAERSTARLFLEIEYYIDKRTDNDDRSVFRGLFPPTTTALLLRRPAEILSQFGYLKVVQHVSFDDQPAFCGCIDSLVPANSGVLQMNAPGDIYVSGYALVPKASPAKIVLVSAGDDHLFVTGARVEGHVSRGTNRVSTPLLQCRWEALVPGYSLPRGEFQLKAWLYDADNARFLKLADCNGPTRVVVTPAPSVRAVN
jgi:hypothetical protein